MVRGHNERAVNCRHFLLHWQLVTSVTSGAPKVTSRFRKIFRTHADSDHHEMEVSSQLNLSDDAEHIHISLADFSPTPSGRNDDDGEYNATRFREKHLLPALKDDGFAEVDFEGVAVCAASFLEEAFTPLVTEHGFTPEHLAKHLKIHPGEDHLHDDTVELVRHYIGKAAQASTSS